MVNMSVFLAFLAIVGGMFGFGMFGDGGGSGSGFLGAIGTDYGDAPAPYVQAWHNYETYEWLGEEDTVDDGIYWNEPLIAGEASDVTFEASTNRSPESQVYVNIWADWDQSGTWESEEQVVSWYGSVLQGIGTVIETVQFLVPIDAVEGTTWLRARLAQEDVGPTGGTEYGECEDYMMSIMHTPEPTTVALFGGGLLGLAALIKLKKRRFH